MTLVSIIVPLYNEEKRCKAFLSDLMAFSKNVKSYEIIFVNDGSADQTLNMIHAVAKKNKQVRIISYSRNKGKGHAVRQGVLASKGEKIIFIDADGSTHPGEITGMLKSLDSYDVVVGTRSSSHSKVVQPFLRKFIGVSFNIYVNLLFAIRIQDTLCGFKGFKRSAALTLFQNLKSERWLFDVELFYKIRKRKLSLYQQPITWVHRKGSKFRIFDPLKMAFELLKLRLQLFFS